MKIALYGRGLYSSTIKRCSSDQCTVMDAEKIASADPL
jgi:hypothetical protein